MSSPLELSLTTFGFLAYHRLNKKPDDWSYEISNLLLSDKGGIQPTENPVYRN
jgi:hypothetical protein